MTAVFRIACLQMNSGPDVADNLAWIDQAVTDAENPDLLLLPENFAQMPKSRSTQYIENEASGEVQTYLSSLARRLDCVVVAGSLPVRSNGNEKPFARSLVFDAAGKKIAHYDKLHLFDVSVTKNSGEVQHYRESDLYQHGVVDCGAIDSSPVQPPNLDPVSLNIGEQTLRLGLSICYDLRFAEMYRALARAGAELIIVPSAFTEDTGRAHWETLLRARAIENQVFIAAPAQVGEHANQRRTWGHSMIVDPWGTAVAELAKETGLLVADIDLQKIKEVRERFPIESHRRL